MVVLAAIILIAVVVIAWLDTGCAPGNCSKVSPRCSDPDGRLVVHLSACRYRPIRSIWGRDLIVARRSTPLPELLLNHQSLSSFIWSAANLLRGDYKQSDYGKVILPFTVLRRLDCVLEPTKAAVFVELADKQKAGSIRSRSFCARPGRASTTRPSWT